MDLFGKLTDGALLFIAGGVLLLIAIVRLRQARAALQQARIALKERNQFLGMMAHEMLTPLQTIVSSVELIELGGKMPPGDQGLRRLRRSAQQLEAQMNDTVEFARLSGGRLKVSPRLFQPDLMMQLVVAEFDEPARERGVRLQVQVDPQPCPRVVTDPARLRQIVANLVSNAAKYASPGVVLCSVQVRESKPQITVSVSDQGPGLDPSINVWEPFTRGKGQVQAQGGSVRVVTRAGLGSTFMVQVPAEVEVVADRSLAQVAPGQLRVLVVEDDPDVRASLQAMLLALGAQVELAGSVEEAAERLEAMRYNGVLLDLRLPDGSGYDVAELVSSDMSLNRGTPLVALSAYHEADVSGDALFAAKFEKPISVARLRSALALFR